VATGGPHDFASAVLRLDQYHCLAQGSAQETTGISAGAVRIPPEELGLGVGGQRGGSKQVSYFDPRHRSSVVATD
jgi:hypothetical protein